MSASRIAPAPIEGPPGAAAGRFLKRAEVRDVLAWMRLLVDPQDAAAVVRALARPPIGLRQVDLARVIQVARRRKLDLVLGLAAATESPQVPPEARERIQRFVELHRSASAELDTVAPDVFLERLIDRLGMPGRSLLAPEQEAEQRESLQRLLGMAVEFVISMPTSSTRDLARHLATVVPQPDSEAPPQQPVADPLEAMLGILREELLGGIARIGGRLGELRLDTDLDISHGVVRYLELLKLSALMQRPDGQSVADALADVNVRLLAAASPLQREILQTSTLDEAVLAAEGEEYSPAQAIGFREEHSLGPFLPRKGAGLALSASDIETYRSCPLRYKFARVLRIPTEQTIHQRFGIAVHQVLERFHAEGSSTLGELLELLDVSWRRGGFGWDGRDGELLEKARTALRSYHAHLHGQDAEPVWFERSFSFRIGPHHLRGRVDRVDRLAPVARAGGADGGAEAGSAAAVAPGAAAAGADVEYELIDYKTGRPRSVEELGDDVQLSLYALAAKEDWQLQSSRQAYYYVLDDIKVPVPRGERDADAVKDIVLEIGEGIMAQEFEPTPSPSACRICDYRIVCPAAEG